MAQTPRLAARCPACQTIFRIAADQLKLRGGLVRCGRCDTVFDGSVHLLKLDEIATASVATTVATTDATTEGASSNAAATHSDATSVGAPSTDPPPAAATLLITPDPDAEHGGAAKRGDEDVHPSNRTPVDATNEAFADVSTTPLAHTTNATTHDSAPFDPVELATVASVQPSAPRLRYRRAPLGAHRWVFRSVDCKSRSTHSTSVPTFVHAAQAASHAGATSHRWGWRLLLTLLTVSAVLQAAYWWRGPLAAAYPALRPTLTQACATLQCTIPPARHLRGLAIDGTELHKPDGTHDHFLLSLNLRSRAKTYIALPAIELVLTDLDDGILVRRVLQPADYLRPSEQALRQTGLPPDTELTLRVRFQSQTAAVNYRVQMFYP